MTNFWAMCRNFLRSEDGPTAVEYAVMLALIIIVCVAAIGSVGTKASDMWGNDEGRIQNALRGGS